MDIDLNDVYVYDPASELYGLSHFDKNVTAIALLENQEGVSLYSGRADLPAHREHRGQLCVHSALVSSGADYPAQPA